jgi:prolyl oligopeptidase
VSSVGVGVAALLVVLACGSAQHLRVRSYPPAARGNVTDDYHGTRVADPYRWLEDLDSPETRAW